MGGPTDEVAKGMLTAFDDEALEDAQTDDTQLEMDVAESQAVASASSHDVDSSAAAPPQAACMCTKCKMEKPVEGSATPGPHFI